MMAAALAAAALGLFAATGAAQATASGPACAPATPDGSALLDGAVTVSPMPGATDAPPQTQLRFAVGDMSSARRIGCRGVVAVMCAEVGDL
jgi:hypothetical protein